MSLFRCSRFVLLNGRSTVRAAIRRLSTETTETKSGQTAQTKSGEWWIRWLKTGAKLAVAGSALMYVSQLHTEKGLHERWYREGLEAHRKMRSHFDDLAKTQNAEIQALKAKLALQSQKEAEVSERADALLFVGASTLDMATVERVLQSKKSSVDGRKKAIHVLLNNQTNTDPKMIRRLLEMTPEMDPMEVLETFGCRFKIDGRWSTAGSYSKFGWRELEILKAILPYVEKVPQLAKALAEANSKRDEERAVQEAVKLVLQSSLLHL